MKKIHLELVVSLALLVLCLGRGVAVIAQRANEPEGVTVLAAPALQNPGFDNTRWYEFKDRYGQWLTGSWVPDDDDGQRLQDWRLWYMRHTPLLKAFPESGIIQAGIESVALRTYDGDVQEGGLYQVIYNVTPCLHYQFQMHGLSRPDAGLSNSSAQLRVGMDPTGWHTNPAEDPALPSWSDPDTIVWSAPQDFKYPNFGLLQVTAEARANKVTVYTRALAYGGMRHAIVWDTGAFAEVTPAMLHDPAALPTPSLSASATTGAGWAQISWVTAAPAVSQVYYRLVPVVSPPPNYPHKVYLPLVVGGQMAVWTASPINKTPVTGHTTQLTGLLSGRTYEYIVVSRGLSSNACTTWVSAPQQFTTP